MRKTALLAVIVLAFTACGGDDDSDGAGSAGTTQAPSGTTGTTAPADATDAENGSGSDVVDRQPAGRASVSVDGEQYTLDTVGPIGCEIGDGEFNVGFLFGDNEVSFIAGGNSSGSGWRGRIDINIQSADGITNYFADLSGGGSVAVDGASMSYSGPWQVFRPGSAEAVPAGDGTLSATCS